MFPKNSANRLKCAISMWKGVLRHLASMLLISLDHLAAGIFNNVIAEWIVCVEQLFLAKNYLQSSYYKN